MKFIFYIAFCLLSGYQSYAQDSITVCSSGHTVWGIAGINLGFSFRLKNIETNKTYTSNVLSLFRQRHSCIENLPAGKYQVVGNVFNMESNKEDPERTFFGTLEFEQNKNYYLGNFVGRRKIGVNKPVIYRIENDEIPKELIKVLRRRNLLEKDEELIKLYPYNSDSLVIGLEPQR